MTTTGGKSSLKEIKADRSLADQVRGSIRDAIIEGQLEPGSLHSVQSLAIVFNVSRTPVREALIDLSSAGMVEFERNRGVRILQPSVQDLEEIMAIRALLEVPSARRAATRITESQLLELRASLEQMEKAAEKQDEVNAMASDRRFHEIINLAADNSRLANYVDSLRDLILTRGVSTVGRSRSLTAVVREHHEIFDAMERQDPDAAARAMKGHLVNTATLLLRQETETEDPGTVRFDWDELVPG